MNHLLESSYLSLERARHHVADYEVQSRTFMSGSPFGLVTELDGETQELVRKARLLKPVPLMLNGAAADAIGNLRNALDHAGYAVSVAAGGKGKKTYFPFGGNETDLQNARRGGSAEIPEAIFAVMVSFKPYRGGNDALWSLNRLSNVNKHRMLTPMVIQTGDITATDISLKGGGYVTVPQWDCRKQEVELMRYSRDAQMDFSSLKLTTFISFNDVPPAIRVPASAVMQHLCDIVQQILTAVTSEARAIGICK